MSSDLLKFLSVIVAAFLGSAVSHYFSFWKYQKDILYQKKVETYIHVVNSILNFERLCIPNNPPSTIVIAFKDLADSINKAYLFMPKELISFFKKIIGNPTLALMNLTKLDHETCEFILSVDVSQKIEVGIANPQISAALVNIFTPMLKQIPTIGDKLKEDLGTAKIGIHFVDK